MLLQSVREVREQYGNLLYALEWLFTILFTVEYFLRLLSVRRPLLYARSFFGVVDLLAIIPTYLSIFAGQPLSAGDSHTPFAPRVSLAETF